MFKHVKQQFHILYLVFDCMINSAIINFMLNIRCCDGRGCKRNYHLSCLDPPLADVPFGDWYCLACVIKKIKSGVHSVSKGVESILGARVVEASDVDGMKNHSA